MKLKHVLASKGRDLFTVRPDATVLEAVASLAEHNIGALVVVDEGRLPVGMLSERDVMRAAASGTDLGKTPVRDVMTSQPVTGTPDDDVEPVLQTMTAGHFRHLPIVDDGQLVGIVTLGDLVKSTLSEYRGALETREAELMERRGV